MSPMMIVHLRVAIGIIIETVKTVLSHEHEMFVHWVRVKHIDQLNLF